MQYKSICRIPGKTGLFEILYENSRIEKLEPLPAGGTGREAVWVSPGLFDIQLNGMIGHSLSAKGLTEDNVREIDTELEKHGILFWCPTLTTQDPLIIEENLRVVKRVIEEEGASNIVCIHLEGHYISSEEGYAGAHMPRFIRDPDSREFDRWQKLAGGTIRLFSLAPERKGALEFIRKLRSEGVKVGLVHHHADHERVMAAAAAGADLSSHLLNGCAPLIHRQHNVIWSQLSLDELWASFIADGHHIPHYTLRALIKAKGMNRSIITSDLVYLSGLPDGEYVKNENTVVLKDGGLWIKDRDILSGAVKTLDQQVEYLASHSGFSIEEALVMASLNPARYFGLEDRMQMYQGRCGKLAVFSWKSNTLTVEKILK